MIHPSISQPGKGQLRPNLVRFILTATVLLLLWRSNPLLADQGAEPNAPVTAVKIACIARGIYKITGEELTGIGVNLQSIDVDQMALIHYDQSVPIYFTGAESHRFGPHDAFYFFAEGSQEDTIPYINIEKDNHPMEQLFMLHLVPSGYLPLRYKTTEMQVPDNTDIKNYFTQTVSGRIHFEKDPIWQFFEEGGGPAAQTNYLFWAKLTYPASDQTASSMSYSFTLPTVNLRKDIYLRVMFYAVSQLPDDFLHHVAVTINDLPCGEIIWPGRLQYEARLKLPSHVMRKGTNKIEFTLLKPQEGDNEKKNKRSTESLSIDMLMLDWFNLEFKQSTEVQGNYNEFFIMDQADQDASTRFWIRNFTTPDVMVFDIANHEFLKTKPFAASEGSMLYNVNIDRSANPTTTTLVALTGAKTQKATELTPISIHGLFNQPVDCDLLILTHPAFTKSLEPLVQWKRSRGLKVHLVEISDIFNEKSGGYAAPESMRRYIQYLYENQKDKKLKYLLLVGDSSTISKYQTFCPAYAYLQSGTHANDNYFANFKKPDGQPLFAVGRFSVRTTEQIDHVVKKVINYENGKANGLWQTRFFLIASAFAWAREDAKYVMNHYVNPNYLATYLQSDISNNDPNYHARLTQQLVDQFNDGSLITIFYGHGGGSVWEVGPSSNHAEFRTHLFDQSNVAKLTNFDKLPLVFAMTCYTNDFDNPYVVQTLGETFVNSAGGAIGVLGTTGRSVTSWNAEFADTFLKKMYEKIDLRLGDTFVRTKNEIADDNVNSNYLLLGDPSLEFKLPLTDIQVSDLKWNKENSTVTFAYKLPQENKSSVKIDCFLVGENEEVMAQWSEKGSAIHGKMKYHIEPVNIKGNATRVVLCLTDNTNTVHVGGGIIKIDDKKAAGPGKKK